MTRICGFVLLNIRKTKWKLFQYYQSCLTRRRKPVTTVSFRKRLSEGRFGIKRTGRVEQWAKISDYWQQNNTSQQTITQSPNFLWQIRDELQIRLGIPHNFVPKKIGRKMRIPSWTKIWPANFWAKTCWAQTGCKCLEGFQHPKSFVYEIEPIELCSCLLMAFKVVKPLAVLAWADKAASRRLRAASKLV